MPTGIEILSQDQALMFSGTQRYARLVEVVNPIALGVPGSRDYPELDPAALDFVFFQGGQRVLTVRKSGTQIIWEYGDSFAWPEFANDARLMVWIR